ncbi:MAG: UvrD-helicase domain-containing protein [Treponema sp.]|jgi:ATP-dependent helicase/nuclease subunit A|nr:UvrD-helicase domain-containing protein [Treponema sp.]
MNNTSGTIEALSACTFISKLNEEQREAVFCDANAVVAAGAGSGKTAVLASRFAYLVLEKAYTVREILTLTFTRKAATEMYRRIYATLSQLAGEGEGILRERAAQAQADFVHAPIHTLDAYSASLVRQGAIRYGILPDFTVDQERCRELVREEALPFVIAHRLHPVLQALYFQKQPQGIARDLFAEPVLRYSSLAEPWDTLGMVLQQIQEICAAWEKSLRDISETLGHIENCLAETPAGRDPFRLALGAQLAPFTQGDLRFPGAQEIREYFDFLKALPDRERIAGSQGHPLRSQISACFGFLYAFHAVNLRQGKQRDPAKELVKRIRDQAVEWSSLGVFCMQGGLILSFMALLQQFQDRILSKKRREGLLTFSDVARLARRILLEQEDIREQEKRAFKAIMIDEFQDNNELQKDLLFLLAEQPDRKERTLPRAEQLCPGKLFFVGDEKQSIYRFRGADVSVFQHLRHELQGLSLSLRKNYRSLPSLIGGFNALFGGSVFDPLGNEAPGSFASVFVPAPRQLPAYEAAYTPVCAGKEAPETSPEYGEARIRIAILPKDHDEDEAEDEETAPAETGPSPDLTDEFLDPHENEACFVAEQIQELLKQYRPDDIVLLFRAQTHQKYYEQHLRLRNIPYTSGGKGGLFTDGPVQDLMAVLRLVAYPRDREAYGVMLRSPWVSLSLGGLLECLAAQEAPFADALVPRLSPEDQAHFLQGQGLYRRIREQAARMSCAQLLSELWYTEGYRYETEWHPRTAVYRVLYDYLFNLALKADARGQSLAGFSDRIRAVQDGEESLDDQDLDIPLERSGAVRLMSIHKSKGLEFPVVFICGCGNPGRRASNSQGVYWSQEEGICGNPPLPQEWAGMDRGGAARVRRNFFYERAVREERQKRTAELRRLLYVAMTRAEQAVYLVGSLALEAAAAEGEEPFSSRVLRSINDKKARQEKKDSLPLAGDRILDNDTLFGLMLPAALDQLPPAMPEADQNQAGASFFCLEAIPRYRKSQVFAETRSAYTPPEYALDSQGLARFLKRLRPYYENARVMSTPQVVTRHRSATASRGQEVKAAYQLEPAYTGEGGEDLFEMVDALLLGFAQRSADTGYEGKDRFSPADFGTLAHACTEALLNHREAQIPRSLAGYLALEEARTLLSAGKALAERFIASPLGAIACQAAFRKSEYRFRSLSSAGIFIDGTIDLLFETLETVYLVDFKTDRQENPREHLTQMTWYYQAAQVLRKKPCKTYLYYLRSGHAFAIGAAESIGTAARGDPGGGKWI